jgi:predicted CoA-binding protein
VEVAILGASPKADRYANMAQVSLLAHGHAVVGVNPALPDLGGVPVVRSLADLPAGVDTLTVYLGRARSAELADDILGYGFRRVIFNPGAENAELAARLRERGVETLEACTLVMLSNGLFG